MARDYQLDTKAAAEANSGGNRIKESGAYVGHIAQAWGETNEKGTESITLHFVADNGQEAVLPLYTFNGKGESLPSFKTLNAVMCCARLRELKASRGKVTVYDFDEKADVQRDKEVYRDLFGKKIGLFIQEEEYSGQNGVKTRPILFAPFDRESKMVAKEILDKATEAKTFDRILKWLGDNPVKKLKGSRAAASNAAPVDSHEDDDIPF
jgi:hypothetical protein